MLLEMSPVEHQFCLASPQQMLPSCYLAVVEPLGGNSFTHKLSQFLEQVHIETTAWI